MRYCWVWPFLVLLSSAVFAADVPAVDRRFEFPDGKRLDPPIEEVANGLTTKLHGLYRVPVRRRGEADGGCLGLILETALAQREGDARGKRTIKVTDDQGRELEQISVWPGPGRALCLFRLPEADATALTIEVASEFEGYGAPIVIEPLEPMSPFPADGLAAMLGELKLTDEWIPSAYGGDEAMAPGDPPYLLARVHILPTGSRSPNFRSARPMGDGPELALKARISYHMPQGRFACSLRPLRDQAGNELTRMLPNRYGPAWMAGVQRDDILLNCDGVEGRTEVLRYIRDLPPQSMVTLRVRRGDLEMDVPVALDMWEEEFRNEAQGALLSLLLFAEETTEGVPLMCYELQSRGGHGEIPLPTALSVSLRPYVEETLGPVTLENVPLPEELRRE